MENAKSQKEKPNIRNYIYSCLFNIYYNDAYSNIEIDHMIRAKHIEGADAALLTNVVYGTLKHDKELRWELSKLSNVTPKKEATVIILMSLYQFHFADRLPDFAVFHEAVNIAKAIGSTQMSNYVNAILREAQRQNLKYTREEAKSDEEYYSVIYNLPIWVVKMLITHYGKDVALKYMMANFDTAPLSLRVNINRTSKEILLRDKNFVSGKLAKNSIIYVGDGKIAEHGFLKEGKCVIQDESSQYCVEMLDPQDGEKILDMCAAPGSKSTYIATLAPKSKILSIDIHEHRVELMKKQIELLGIKNITCVTFDSTKLATKEKLVGSFDKILLDAPCLGLGVIRRKPDIALSLTGEKLDELVDLQSKLLENAYLLLKPGGTMVYSTCSVNKKENNSQILSFLARHSDMKRVFEKQIFQFEYDSDGFYICKLVKENI